MSKIYSMNNRSFARFISLFLAFMIGSLLASPTRAVGQRNFPTAEKAADALFKAAKVHDKPALSAILGPNSEPVLSSGDEVADNNAREAFVKDYEKKHWLVASGKDTTTLNTGTDDFPFPIPIVKTGDGWHFDLAAGKEELLYRRIGRNELAVIKVCHVFVKAEQEYAAVGHDDQLAGIYAGKVPSDPGKQNGLYWETSPDQPPSPLGPLMAYAAGEGYEGSGKDKDAPFHGYRYRILTEQGAAAPGGAKSYVVDGQLKGGFALLAFPAEYGSSGIMTFMVNQKGIIYQKDLGDKTDELARRITAFDLGKGWVAVQ